MIRARLLEDEYEKNKDIKREDIQKLREWVNSQPHLPSEYITELDLILAYNSCDRSSEVTKQVLDLNFTLRTQIPLMKDLKYDDSNKVVMNAVLTTLLPATADNGDRAILMTLIDPDPKKFLFVPFLRSLTMLIDLWQYRDGTWPGYMIIFSMNKTTASHIARMDITVTQQYLYFLQEAVFSKFNAVHILNGNSLVEMLLNMIKPMVKNDLMKRMYVHSSSKIEGYDMINAALPKELGGEGKSILELRDEAINLIESNQDFIIAQNKKTVDESKRQGKQKSISDFFGSMEGSFKKLDID